jgi:hypothetical protein
MCESAEKIGPSMTVIGAPDERGERALTANLNNV